MVGPESMESRRKNSRGSKVTPEDAKLLFSYDNDNDVVFRFPHIFVFLSRPPFLLRERMCIMARISKRFLGVMKLHA